MGRNTGKVILLMIPCLATLGLLIYSLASQQWVEVDEQRLNTLTAAYELEFSAHENRTASSRLPSRVGPLVGKSSGVNRSTASVTTTTATTTTTSASTSPTTDPDYTADDYDDEENVQDETARHRKRDVIAQSNLFERKTAKGSKSSQQQVENGKQPQQQTHGDFVYVSQLWPVVKRKSVYVECVEYVPLKLKISRSYLIADRKAPIIGHIHYYDDGTFDREAADAAECVSRPGTVYCQFTKTCKKGKSCDGIIDCEDQSDEQSCAESPNRVACSYANDIAGFSCDSKCYQYWHKCDGEPHCFDLSDETNADCRATSPVVNLTQSANYFQRTLASFFPPSSDPMEFTLGRDNYDTKNKCFKRYFNFKSPRIIPKDTLKYLSQSLADNIQETNNVNYHLHLIYTLAFASAVVFALLALLSLMFLSCFGKLCFQCPFWFFGFFQILAWLASLCGLMTFLYAFWMDKQRSIDPNAANTLLPARAEIVRLNPGLIELERLGLSFWLATGAVGSAFFGSFLACIICCRLPSSRHEDKEYKIMQLPTYS